MNHGLVLSIQAVAHNDPYYGKNSVRVNATLTNNSTRDYFMQRSEISSIFGFDVCRCGRPEVTISHSSKVQRCRVGGCVNCRPKVDALELIKPGESKVGTLSLETYRCPVLQEAIPGLYTVQVAVRSLSLYTDARGLYKDHILLGDRHKPALRAEAAFEILADNFTAKALPIAKISGLSSNLLIEEPKGLLLPITTPGSLSAEASLPLPDAITRLPSLTPMPESAANHGANYLWLLAAPLLAVTALGIGCLAYRVSIAESPELLSLIGATKAAEHMN